MGLYNEAQLKQLILHAEALGFYDEALHHKRELEKLQAAKPVNVAKRKQQEYDELVAKATHLKSVGYSNLEIGRRLDIPESTVRTLLLNRKN